jgi:hypothetical protein
MNPTMPWPSFSAPGFPTIAIGGMGSLAAGIGFVLNPPEIKVPDIDLFIGGFFAFGVGMPSFPATTLSISGVSVPLPAFSGVDIPNFDPSITIKMVGLMIAAPFLIIKGIMLSLINDGHITLPTLSGISGILIAAGLDLGLPNLDLFVPCLAQAMFDAVQVIPV